MRSIGTRRCSKPRRLPFLDRECAASTGGAARLRTRIPLWSDVRHRAIDPSDLNAGLCCRVHGGGGVGEGHRSPAAGVRERKKDTQSCDRGLAGGNGSDFFPVILGMYSGAQGGSLASALEAAPASAAPALSLVPPSSWATAMSQPQPAVPPRTLDVTATRPAAETAALQPPWNNGGGGGVPQPFSTAQYLQTAAPQQPASAWPHASTVAPAPGAAPLPVPQAAAAAGHQPPAAAPPPPPNAASATTTYGAGFGLAGGASQPPLGLPAYPPNQPPFHAGNAWSLAPPPPAPPSMFGPGGTAASALPQSSMYPTALGPPPLTVAAGASHGRAPQDFAALNRAAAAATAAAGGDAGGGGTSNWQSWFTRNKTLVFVAVGAAILLTLVFWLFYRVRQEQERAKAKKEQDEANKAAAIRPATGGPEVQEGGRSRATSRGGGAWQARPPTRSRSETPDTAEPGSARVGRREQEGQQQHRRGAHAAAGGYPERDRRPGAEEPGRTSAPRSRAWREDGRPPQQTRRDAWSAGGSARSDVPRGDSTYAPRPTAQHPVARTTGASRRPTSAWETEPRRDDDPRRPSPHSRPGASRAQPAVPRPELGQRPERAPRRPEEEDELVVAWTSEEERTVSTPADGRRQSSVVRGVGPIRQTPSQRPPPPPPPSSPAGAGPSREGEALRSKASAPPEILPRDSEPGGLTQERRTQNAQP